MGETRVDLLHLLEDLRDAYPGALEETILTEIVANALDSGAGLIRFATDPAAATLTVVDDGTGMSRRELSRYHDLATTTKQRGRGIGFAGVGIKLGLLACEEVVTETRRDKTHVASSWHLKSRHKAPWRWMPPPGLVAVHGTGVRLRLTNALSPLLDEGFVEGMLRRHFEPLLDTTFDDVLRGAYPDGIRFSVGTRVLPRSRSAGDRAPLAVKLPRKRKPSGIGFLVRRDAPLDDEERGLAISTLGKVIKRGWDWVGVTPTDPDRIGGLLEVPALAECLTLNKADFIRTGQRGAVYLAHRKAIQQTVSDQLAAWGDERDASAERQERRARPVERDVRKVLAELSDDFPLLATLVDRHRGGQRKLPLGRPGGSGVGPATSLVREPEVERPSAEPPAPSTDEPPSAERREPSAESQQRPASESLPGSGPRRPARYGLQIRFESRPDDDALGRLVESTVWVNDAHPAYRRSVKSRSEGYHLALAVAMALAPLAVEPAAAHAFVTAFLKRWGEARP